jgi:hypothetical protein
LDSSNYCWEGGSTDDLTITLTINKQTIDISGIEAVQYEYDGNLHTILDLAEEDWWNESTFGDSSVMSVKLYDSSGEVSGVTNAGTYTVKFKLEDTDNYQWQDGTTGEKPIDYVITKKPLSFNLTLENGVPAFNDDGTPKGATVDDSNKVSGDDTSGLEVVYHYYSGDGTDLGTDKPANRGTYTLVVELIDKNGDGNCNYDLSDDEQVKTYTYTYSGKAVEFTPDMLRWQYENGTGAKTEITYKAGAQDYYQYTTSDRFAVTYTGNEYVFSALEKYSNGKTIAEYGVKIKSYVNQSATLAGDEYYVTVTLEEADDTWAVYERTFTLFFKIEKAMFDLSEVQWNTHEGMEFAYTGSVPTISVSNLPEGLTVTYLYSDSGHEEPSEDYKNMCKTVGSYATTVEFAFADNFDAKDNYYLPGKDGDWSNCILTNGKDTFNVTLNWSIVKASIDITWEKVEQQVNGGTARVPQLVDDKGVVVYTYRKYSKTATDHLGDEVTLSEITYDASNLQEFYVVATLKQAESESSLVNNYTIANGRAIKYFVVGSTLEEVTIVVDSTYEYGSTSNIVKFAGETTCTYDDITITYYNKNGQAIDYIPTDAGTYSLTVVAKDAAEYNITNGSTTFSFTINPKTLDLSGLSWNYNGTAFEYAYDGTQAVVRTVELTGFTKETEFLKDYITYTNNEKSDVGNYTATFAINTSEISTNYTLVNVPSSKQLKWKIVSATITKPSTTLADRTYYGDYYDLLAECTTLPSDWANYIDLVVKKDGVDVTEATNNGTQVVDAGVYTLTFTFKDAVKSSNANVSNISFINKSGTTYDSAQVTSTVKKLEIVVAGWYNKPPKPIFTSDDVSYDFYEVVYLDENKNIISKEEAASEDNYGKRCYAYVKPVFGMEDNIEISTVDGSELYEWYMTYDGDAKEMSAPTLNKSEFTYDGKTVNIVKYLNDFDKDAMIASGDLGKSAAGTYTIYITLNAEENVVWADDISYVVLTYTINKAEVSVTWDTSGATPVIKTDLPDDAIEYEYYQDGVKVDKDDLEDGESYEVRATISDKYKDNYDFGDLTGDEAVTTFSYEKPDDNSTSNNNGNPSNANENTDGTNGTNGTNGTSGTSGTSGTDGTVADSEDGTVEIKGLEKLAEGETYSLEFTTKSTDDYSFEEGGTVGYCISLWIMKDGEKLREYDSTKTVTLTVAVPDTLKSFTLYKMVNGELVQVDESEYKVENGVLTINTTLSTELVFNGPEKSNKVLLIVLIITLLVVILVMIAVLLGIIRRRQLLAENEAENEALRKKIKEQENTINSNEKTISAHKKTIAAKQHRIDELEGADGGFNDQVALSGGTTATSSTDKTDTNKDKKKKSLFSRKKNK